MASRRSPRLWGKIYSASPGQRLASGTLDARCGGPLAAAWRALERGPARKSETARVEESWAARVKGKDDDRVVRVEDALCRWARGSSEMIPCSRGNGRLTGMAHTSATAAPSTRLANRPEVSAKAEEWSWAAVERRKRKKREMGRIG